MTDEHGRRVGYESGRGVDCGRSWLRDNVEFDLPLHRVPIPPPRHEVDIKPSTYQVRWGPFTRRPRGWWNVRCLQCHTFGGPMRRVDAEKWRDGHDTAVRQLKHWHTCAAEDDDDQ